MAAQMSAIPPAQEKCYFHQSPKCYSSEFLFTPYVHSKALRFNNKLDACIFSTGQTMPSIKICRWTRWSIRSMVEGNRSDLPVRSSSGQTRLGGAIQAFQRRLTGRVMKLRKGLLMKVLSFLVGFYCATAFATVIGQTGDWDILSAGLAMFVVEGIGALMYRTSFKFLDSIRGLIGVMNYWKAGLSLGLFLDAFKY